MNFSSPKFPSDAVFFSFDSCKDVFEMGVSSDSRLPSHTRY